MVKRQLADGEQMKLTSHLALALAFAVSFLAIGLPYWQIPYAHVSLPKSLIGFGLLTVAVLVTASRFVAGVRLLPTTLVIGASAPCAVIARVIYDTSTDPTSHNLWPFEIVIAIALGFVASLVGAAIGGLLASATRTGA
jgi:hypothetical protein